MTEEITEILQQVRQAFIDKHGREPEPDELLFGDLPHLEHLEAMLVDDMEKAGLDPAFIFAFEKTGLLVSEENQHLIPEKDLEDWRAAIEEYQRKHSKQQNPVESPMGTMAYYGPDDKTTTKIAACVFKGPNSKTIRALGGYRRHDEPKNPARDQGLLRETRGQVSLHERWKRRLSTRGGQGLPDGRGLPVLPVLGGQAGEQSVVLMPGSDSMAAQRTTQTREGSLFRQDSPPSSAQTEDEWQVGIQPFIRR